MAIDLKQGIDLTQIGAQIKALFAKDSNVFQNKTVISSIVSILVTLLLVYLIYDIFDNQSVFNEAKGRHDGASLKLSKIENQMNKALVNNKVYFKQLKNSAKNQSQLSANITSLVSQYSLLLKSVELNADVDQKKGKGINLIVSGSYLNLIRFSSAMNKVLSASQLIDLSVKKSKKASTLVMSLSIVFSSPPPPNSLPTQAIEKTDNLNLVTLSNIQKSEKSLGSDLLALFISSVNASESELAEILPIEQAKDLPPLEVGQTANGPSLFKQAYSSARAQGLIKFEFTNKAGETKQYLTGLKPEQNILAIEKEIKPVKLAEILPIEQAKDLPALKSFASKSFNPTNKKDIKLKKAKQLSSFQKAYADALVAGQTIFEFKDKEGKTGFYKTDKEGYKLAGFVENSPEEPIAEPRTKKSIGGEAQLSSPTENLRDPFAAPGASRAPKINRNGQDVASEDPYYLSGVLTSEASELCVIINPIGESIIYHTGDTITGKITITGIFSDAIMTSLSNTKISIGDEIR